MNKQIWIGIIVWGSLIVCFALGAMNPTSIVENSARGAVPDRETTFLLAAGIFTMLTGVIGLLRFSRAAVRSECPARY